MARLTQLLLVPTIAATFAAAPATRPASQPAKVEALDQRLLPPGSRLGEALDHPQAAAIALAVQNIAASPAIEATKVDRASYLKFIDSQMRVMRTFQDAEGRIIDPIEKKEMQYATPCFAHAVSVLASTGHTKDQSLIDAGMKAMDRAVWEMVNNKAADSHGDFFTWPVMLALTEFKSIAPADRWQRWHDDLKRVDPSKLYNFYNNRQSLNWVLVHTAGEFLRHQYGMTSPGYIESMLNKQDHHFTPEGQYSEGGQPIAYDLFSRLFITGMLAHGYHGGHFDVLRQRMWRGAWMSLLMQSPTGEAPTGHRSSQHIWVEAEQCVILEAFARACAEAGDAKQAAIFKRAAHLSLAAMSAWLRPDGTGYVLKNKFPIEEKFAYESYSTHTQYNLLACSMAAQAYQLADESIKESAAPADVGGYAVVVDPFHKAFAIAGGGYAEVELTGDNDDRNWVPPGIVRIKLVGANAQIGPADGVGVYKNKDSKEDPSYAVGPAWQDASGKWTRLASLRLKSLPTVKILEQSPAKTSLELTYPLDGGLTLTQQISVEPKRAHVTDTLSGGEVRAVRAYFPMLVDDGLEKTQINTSGNAATLRKRDGGPITFTVNGTTSLSRTGLHLKSRNGYVEPIFGEVSGTTISYDVTTE